VTSSISLNTSQRIQWQQAQSTHNNIIESSSFAAEIKEDSPSSNAINNSRVSHRISNIDPQAIKMLYSQIKTEADAQLNDSNYDNKELKAFDYLQNNIDAIVDYPIEVEIQPDEINAAILYNSLGINYLDVKRIEMRMDLLEEAKGDVSENVKSGAITKKEGAALSEQIQDHQDSLFDQKQALIERKSITESEEALFKQLKMSQVSY